MPSPGHELSLPDRKQPEPTQPEQSRLEPAQPEPTQPEQSRLEPARPEPARPELSRRHAAGAPSARGLLLTLLGEFVLPGDGTAWTSAMITTLGRLGVAEKATRQALLRTAAAGWLTTEKSGRRTRWQLTGAAQQMLTDGAARIYSFAGPAADWDGRWLLVTVRVPEGDRRVLHVLRSRLSWAGFGSVGPGLWVSTHPERAAEATAVLTKAGVGGRAQVFVGTRSGIGDVRDMVSAAWDLAAIEAEYERFIAEFGPFDRGPSGGDSQALGRQVALVHAWRRFPAIDPALPRELLPARWNGLPAAQLFATLHERWSAQARLDWQQLNGAT